MIFSLLILALGVLCLIGGGVAMVRGAVRLAVGTQDWDRLRGTRINRGGRLWREMIDPEQGQAYLRPSHLPDIDHQTAAVELSVGLDGPRQKAYPTNSVRRLTLQSPNGLTPGGVTLIIRSSAKGTLTVANVVGRY